LSSRSRFDWFSFAMALFLLGTISVPDSNVRFFRGGVGACRCSPECLSREGIRLDLVLLIDDAPDARDALFVFLSSSGCRTLVAGDGASGLALAREARPDVVVLDMTLPGIDGWEATRRLRADPRTRGACIIALTGHATGEARQRALDAGVDGYLVKPCRPEDVIAEIRRLRRL
jgi:CheY-like chemotaxis protein